MYPNEIKDKLVQKKSLNVKFNTRFVLMNNFFANFFENINWKFESGKVYVTEKSIRDNSIIYDMII